MRHNLLYRFGIIILIVWLFIGILGCSDGNSEKVYIDEFWTTVDRIQAEFVYENYKEIMHEQSHILALPEKCKEIDDAENFLMDQKLFVFKNVDEASVIILQMIAQETTENSWNSCISYKPQIFNAEQSLYNDFFADKLPDVEFAIISFTYSHCTYSIACLSNKSDHSVAATKAVHFSNELIDFLTNSKGG